MYLLYAPRQKFGLIPPGQSLFTEEVKFWQNVAFCPKFYWQKVHLENGCQDISPHSFKRIRNNRQLRTVTIFATGGIGDSMWAMPFARAIKEKYPQCSIIAVVDKPSKPVWQNVPYVIGTIQNAFWNVAGVVRKSDEVFDFGGIATILKKQMRLDPIEATFQMAGFPLPKEKEKCRPQLIVTIDEGKAAEKFLDNNNIKVKRDKIICIGLDASTSNRQWPFEYVKALSKDFIAEGLKVIWLGKAQEYNKKFLDKETNAIGALNLCSETSLRQAIAILALADLYIGPNSGLMVIATSLMTPTIGIFGAFSPKIRAKFYDRFSAVWGKPKCAPCGEHWTECRLGHPAPCMKLAYPDKVYKEAKIIMAKYPRHITEKLPIE
jgi:ADP-heptose:LPS heptosyltransferase